MGQLKACQRSQQLGEKGGQSGQKGCVRVEFPSC